LMKKMEMTFAKYDASKAGMLNKMRFEAFLMALSKSNG